LGYMMKTISDVTHKELSPKEIHKHFAKEYVNFFTPLDIRDATYKKSADIKKRGTFDVDLKVDLFGEHYQLHGVGNGRLDAVRNALNTSPYTFDYTFVTYSEHALESDSNSRAVAYVAIADKDETVFWGVGTHEDIVFASINALVSAINRMTAAQQKS